MDFATDLVDMTIVTEKDNIDSEIDYRFVDEID
jgi:hypothetical protein